jgi:diguanylate cyclase
MPPSSQDVLNVALTLLPSFGLLWSAGQLWAQARRQAAGSALGFQGLAPLLVAAAVWWPAYQAAVTAQTVDASAVLLAAIAALGLACGWASQFGAAHPLVSGKHFLGVVMTFVASVLCTSALHALPGQGWVRDAALPLLLALPLGLGCRLLHRQSPHRVSMHVQRAAGALLAAGSLAFVALRLPPAGASPALEPGALALLALLVMGLWTGVALGRLRLLPASAQVHGPANAGTAPPLPDRDPLTGLGSRAALEAQLAQWAQERRASRRPFAALSVNLDSFKPLNATYGHAVGDEVLRQVGQRLQALAGTGGTVCRLSGDEFVMLVDGPAPGSDPVALAQKVAERVAQPLRLATRELSITSCVGMALFPQHGDAERLLARADAALQAGKRTGAGQVCLFAPAMETDLNDDFELLRDFRHALDNNVLTLVYQPKIDAASGQVTAAEALLRWRHPQRGAVPPTVFVPLAERFGLIAKLGDWVIENALRQARVWGDHGLNMRVAINISAQHMRQPDLGERIAGALSRYRIDPTRLTCEITESVAMENTQATQATFEQLGRLGVHLSIDDFGTGYSSLAYLRRLPASEVKIDRSFVQDLERSADARSVVDAVVKLAHALGKRVVAEGVENVRQRRVLSELGCDELQGYLFAHPMSADDLLQWALDDLRRDEQAFRSSLYMQPAGDADLDIEREAARHPLASGPLAQRSRRS